METAHNMCVRHNPEIKEYRTFKAFEIIFLILFFTFLIEFLAGYEMTLL